MARCSGKKRGKYYKTCYFSKEFFKRVDKSPNNIYDFAVEFADEESFIAAYSDSCGNYNFVDKKGNQTNGRPEILSIEIRPNQTTLRTFA